MTQKKAKFNTKQHQITDRHKPKRRPPHGNLLIYSCRITHPLNSPLNSPLGALKPYSSLPATRMRPQYSHTISFLPWRTST